MTKAKRHVKRRIAVVTGTRAEYGLLESTMQAIRKHPQLNLQLVVTGTHLLRRFGRTVDHIIADGWKVDAQVRMQRGNDSQTDQAEGLARGISGIAGFLEEAKTDIVVVLGDRIEAMAGALAAVTTGKLLAHIHGGDVASGDFDDQLRNAITKLAHIHFPATAQSAKRIKAMGEKSSRVYCVGAPGIDRLAELARKTQGKKTRSGMALVIQHAYGRSPSVECRAMTSLLKAVDSCGLRQEIICPNSDRGHTGVFDAISKWQDGDHQTGCTVHRSLGRDAFLAKLIEADVLVGNSSCGIIEAATAGTPSVNIGLRQRGRQRSGSCVVDSDETFESIRTSIESALRKRPARGAKTAYGNGNAGQAIASALLEVPLIDRFRRKQ